MSITFSSCFYIIKSKFDHRTYIEWMNNLISIVNNFSIHKQSAFNSKGNSDKVIPLLKSHGLKKEENISTYIKEVNNVKKIRMNMTNRGLNRKINLTFH